MSKRFTEAEIAEVWERREAGEPTRSIARRLGPGLQRQDRIQLQPRSLNMRHIAHIAQCAGAALRRAFCEATRRQPPQRRGRQDTRHLVLVGWVLSAKRPSKQTGSRT